MTDRKPLIIVGASARAAAQSAVRSKFQPWCIDQFGDTDLRECAAAVTVVSDWPDGIVDAIAAAPDAPLVFAGALENSPELLEKLGARFPIAGASPQAIRLVRDPIWLQDCVKAAGLPSLAIRRRLTTADAGNRWLLKPRASAAGFGIQHANSPATASETGVFQEFAEGVSVSGLFMGSRVGGHLLGLTSQLHGLADAGASGFLHCGSIGPLRRCDIEAECFDLARAAGNAIARLAGVRGLFGIDFVFNPESRRLCTLEVNPRWTASAELYERAIPCWPLMEWHVDASLPGPRYRLISQSGGSIESMVDSELEQIERIHGRIVVYSSERITIRPSDLISNLPASVDVADIPVSGTVIESGHPVCTVLLQAETAAECQDQLCAVARQVREALAADAR